MSVLVLGTGTTIKRLKQVFKSSPDFVFLSFAPALKDLDLFIDSLAQKIKKGTLQNITFVMGLTDTSSLIAYLLNKRLGFSGPSAKALLNCQNKYICREISSKFLPQNTPKYALASLDTLNSSYRTLKNENGEVFYKPVKGSLSFFSSEVTSPRQLSDVYLKFSKIKKSRNKFFNQIVSLLPKEEVKDFQKSLNQLLLEQVIKGEQITLDGYVDSSCNVGFFGITKSTFLPNTLSFTRFDFPYSFNTVIDEKIQAISKTLVRSLGLKRSLFNIEYMVDGQDIKIIEINPRPSSQFMYLIHHSLGTHPLEYAFKDKPPCKSTILNYSSIFILRRDQDALALKVPSKSLISSLERKYKCEINLFVKENKKLSQYTQDEYTYRYAEIKVFGNSFAQNKLIYNKIKASLPFEWQKV